MAELERLKDLVRTLDSLGYERDWNTLAYELNTNREPQEVEVKWSTNKIERRGSN